MVCIVDLLVFWATVPTAITKSRSLSIRPNSRPVLPVATRIAIPMRLLIRSNCRLTLHEWRDVIRAIHLMSGKAVRIRHYPVTVYAEN